MIVCDLNTPDISSHSFCHVLFKTARWGIKEEKDYVLEGRRLKPKHTGTGDHETGLKD
jgi:hypothetical protein